MSQEKIKECLSVLRRADEMLLTDNELAISCHVSLAIELLAQRLDRD